MNTSSEQIVCSAAEKTAALYAPNVHLVIIEEPRYQFIALYTDIDTTITLEIQSVIYQFNLANIEGLTLEQFTEILLLHEIGHHFDQDLDKHHRERLDLIYAIQHKKIDISKTDDLENAYFDSILRTEIIAWKKAGRLLPSSISRVHFYQVMRLCLHNYVDSFAYVLFE